MKGKCLHGMARLRDLWDVYRDVVREGGCVSMDDVCRVLAGSEAPRFYVSVEQAVRVLRRMRRYGEVAALSGMRENKRSMFRDIAARVCGEIDRRNVGRVVLGAAPNFYLSEKSLRTFVYRARFLFSRRRRLGNG